MLSSYNKKESQLEPNATIPLAQLDYAKEVENASTINQRTDSKTIPLRECSTLFLDRIRRIIYKEITRRNGEIERSQEIQAGSRAEIESSRRICEGSQSTRSTSKEIHSFNEREIWRYNLQESKELAQITQALNQQKGLLIYQASFFKQQLKDFYQQYDSYYPSIKEEKLNTLMKQFNSLLQKNAFKDNSLMVEDKKMLDLKEVTRKINKR